jgi:hypothetical protein
LTSVQWLKCRELREAITSLTDDPPTYPSIVITQQDPMEHSGRCEACGATARGISVKVELTAGDRRMVREYQL